MSEAIATIGPAQLPDTLEDLTQFVLVGNAKLSAYMIKLRAVNRLSVAQEIRDQTLREAQEISTALIAAEQRIGEILLAIPKAAGGDRKTESFKNRDESNFERTKAETIQAMGYSRDEVSDYQRMAQNPEVVQRVLDAAIANGEVVTKSKVMQEIRAEAARVREEMRASLGGEMNAALQKAAQEMEEATRQRDILQESLQSAKEALAELEAREPEVREVPPKDYDFLKRDYAARCQQFDRQRREHLEEKLALEEKIAALEAERKAAMEGPEKPIIAYDERLESNCSAFVFDVAHFLREHGGYTYLTKEIRRVSEESQRALTNSLHKLREFAETMLDAIGGTE